MEPSRLLLRSLVIAVLAGLLVACGESRTDEITFTLYRTSIVNDARLHVASFDSAESEDYNRENFMVAAGLFGGQPGIKTQFWCEKGRFRK